MKGKHVIAGLAAAAVVAGVGAALALTDLTPDGTSQATQANARPVKDTSGCVTLAPDHPYRSYVMVAECGANYQGISATLTLPNPPPQIDSNGGVTSLGQITLAEYTPDDHECGAYKENAIEVGWVRYPSITDRIYLQIGRAIGSQNAATDYPSRDWHPYPDPPSEPNKPQPVQPGNRPGTPLGEPLFDTLARAPYKFSKLINPSAWAADITDKSSVNLEIKYVLGKWMVYVDQNPIGYYLDEAWPGGFHPNTTGWWGEVQSVRKPHQSDACQTPSGIKDDNASCTQMGTGIPGRQSSGAASFTNMKTITDGKTTIRRIYVTDPDLYNSDKYTGPSSGSEPFAGEAFHYGGPGKCVTEAVRTTQSPTPYSPTAPPDDESPQIIAPPDDPPTSDNNPPQSDERQGGHPTGDDQPPPDDQPPHDQPPSDDDDEDWDITVPPDPDNSCDPDHNPMPEWCGGSAK